MEAPISNYIENLSRIPTWIQAYSEGGRLRRLNGQLRGKSLLIVGASHDLLSFSIQEWREIRKEWKILGLNKTFYATKLDYFLSAYPSDVGLAIQSRRTKASIYMRHRGSKIPGAINVRRRPFEGTLEGHLSPTSRILRTRMNALFAALHLALILRPKKLGLCGFGFESTAHFYDYLPEVRERISLDISRLPDAYFRERKEEYASRRAELERLQLPVKQLEETQFPPIGLIDTFLSYKEILEKQGIDLEAFGSNDFYAEAKVEMSPFSQLRESKRAEYWAIRREESP